MEGDRSADGPQARGKSVVRVDGIDTVTGKHKPKQLGTYQSQRSANAAAREMRAEDVAVTKGTVSWPVRRYVAGRTDITPKAQEQYASWKFETAVNDRPDSTPTSASCWNA